jgi:glycosyltransferase involved in cell wall biosynthesis
VHLLRQQGGQLRCALVGAAPERDRHYEEALQKKVIDLGLNDRVQFIGAVSNAKVVPWYRGCLAHVNCSPPGHSLDKSALEAMACGKPSLSSTLGFKETMGKWADRLLFEHRNAEDLATKLEGLLRMRRGEREAVGECLRQSVQERHNLEHLADRLVQLFEQAHH